MHTDKTGSYIRKAMRCIRNREVFLYYLNKICPCVLQRDKRYLECKYRTMMYKKLELDSPNSFNEKLQWLKLYDRKPEYTTMVDKYLVKDYVAGIIGQEYVIPTIGVWNTFEEIDFSQLPNQFVLKCTHDSGGLVICKGKETFDVEAAKRKIDKCLKTNYYLKTREWPYKDVIPRIIAEPYLEDSVTEELRDFKFFTFGGQAKLLFIASERQSQLEETKFDFFDMEFNHLPIINGHPNSKKEIEKPQNFSLMKELAEKLSKDIPHVRVDFYEVNGKVYFGEMTFYHWSGFVPFEPEEWDEILGSWIQLPIDKK